jgi:hypothetical protein
VSRGLGMVQRGCLTTIEKFERKGRTPTTYDVVVAVYRLRRGQWMKEAQYVAVKRALASLRRQGRIVCWRDYGHEYSWRTVTP